MSTFLILLHLITLVYSTNELLKNFLINTNQQLAVFYDLETLANIQNEIQGPNDVVALIQLEITARALSKYLKQISPKVAKYKRLNLGSELERQQLNKIPILGYEALAPKDLAILYVVTANLSDNYKHTRICQYENRTNCTLKLIPDVQDIIHNSKNLGEIEYYWLEWRRKTAKKSDFTKFTELYKKTVKLNGFEKPSDYWFRMLNMSSVEAQKILSSFMLELRPLFLQFHAHVRGSLRKQYGSDLIKRHKPYPQHLSEIYLGNAFRRFNLKWFPDMPYPDEGVPNITESMYTVGLSTTQRIFWNVAEYFRALGYPMLDSELWQQARAKALLDNDQCWHKAWQQYSQKYINLTYCPLVDEERLFNMFETLSDVYYYQSYRGQPTLFQDEPLPNFSEALGKFFALAASSPRYLMKLGILSRNGYDKLPARLNRLYLHGMRIIFLLPIFYVLERYRINVLDSKIAPVCNVEYWRLTREYTGAVPPHERTDDDFDVPAKLLLEVDDEYTSQIFSNVLQFQFYKHFCTVSGQYVPGDKNKPLDLCDLSEQRSIGTHLWRGMSLGASKDYRVVLQNMIGVSQLNISGLLDYFQPLYEWLEAQNKQQNFEIGWH